MSNQQVSVEQVGPVRRIWLDRSDARNAQSREMLDQLDAALDDVDGATFPSRGDGSTRNGDISNIACASGTFPRPPFHRCRALA